MLFIDMLHFFVVIYYYCASICVLLYMYLCLLCVYTCVLYIRPTPSLEELEQAAFQFCDMQWIDVWDSFNGPHPHPYTWDFQLPERCFETLYIITLLEKGFGFDRHDRSITFAREVTSYNILLHLSIVSKGRLCVYNE